MASLLVLALLESMVSNARRSLFGPFDVFDEGSSFPYGVLELALGKLDLLGE
jgi:hypothetical protein